MNFGPAEMAQMIDSVKALITVTIVSGIGIGIVLGAIVAVYRIFFRHRADDQSFQSGMSTVPVLATVPTLATVPALEIDATALSLHSPRLPIRRANNLIRLVDVLAIIIVIAIAGGGFFSYYTSKRSDFEAPLPPTIEPPQQRVPSDFEATYKQLGIPPLPLIVERQQQIQSRLAQLSREACYTDAIVGLGRALLAADYPREAAISSRSFVKRCGSASEVLPQAYFALERINEFPGALEVANELVEALPANGTFRYWRALAYDRTGQFSLAIVDYMNTVQLFGDQKIIYFDVFYQWSQTYAALHQYCDAISPIEMYISLDPINRRTPQTTKIISDYAEKGGCDKSHAIGTARIPFTKSGVRTLSVVVNNVAGTMILDTGATFVSITPRFADKAALRAEKGNQVVMQTVGGKALADIGYAKSISAGKAAAYGVTTVVMRDRDADPFGKGIDGLLGMSFLSRFNVKLSPTAVEMTATPLR